MECHRKQVGVLLLAIIVIITLSGVATAQGEFIDVQFEQPPDTGTEISRTLQSLVKIQGTGQFCEDGIYLITQYGNREDLFQKENQAMIDNPLIEQTWRHCSLFSTATEHSVYMGRNWDNQNVGSIIISLNFPPGGYSSISFTRSIDLGFGHKDLEQHTSSPFGNRLLLAPFYAYDGINEHGLAVGVSGVRQTTIKPQSGKELVYDPFLLRKILDQTKNIEEAVSLVEKYIPFDIDKNSLSVHFMVADASGRSVILEYDQDRWRTIYSDTAWQVLTTKPIYNVPDKDLRERCWRYRSISAALDSTQGNVDWKAGMKILQNVEQKGTTWSVVYALTTKELFFSVYQQWDTIYHLTMP